MTFIYKFYDGKFAYSTFITVACLIVLCSSCLSIYAVIKTEELQQELKATTQIVRDLKAVLEIVNDFEEYEEGSAQTDYNDIDDEDILEDIIEDIKLDANKDYESNEVDSNFLKKINGMIVKIGDEKQRTKRDVVAATNDGVLIKSESYAEFKRKNRTRSQESQRYFPKTTIKHYEEVDIRTTPKPAPIMNRKSRVMKTDNKSKTSKQLIKKPMLKTLSDTQDQSGQEMTIVRDVSPLRRKHRQRLEMLDESPLRLSKLRPQPAIQFSGDTSKYILGQHHNYKGNGHLRHHSKTFVDWKTDEWVKSLGMDQHFGMHDGIVTIKESGLYFVYAQIYYLDEHDTNGYHVYKNNEIILQCTTMTHSNERVLKGNTCYTGSAIYLSDGDKIEVRDISESRYSLFEPGKSFFGILKLGDIKMK